MSKLTKVICAILCVTFVLGMFFTLKPSDAMAEIGGAARKRLENYSDRMQAIRNRDIKGEPEVNEDEVVFWFPIPEGFLPTESDGHDYVSIINPYDTSDEWKALEDAEEMRSVSQIPAEKIASATTEDIVLYCMNYNLFSDVFAFSSIKQGFEIVKERYNGLQELSVRNDSAATLLSLYKSYDLSNQMARDSYSTIRLTYLEGILLQDDILAQLSPAQCRELAAECYGKILKIMDSESDSYNVTHTMLLGITCLYESDVNFAALIDASDGAKSFVETGLLDIDSISDAELGAIVNYLNGIYYEGKV